KRAGERGKRIVPLARDGARPEAAEPALSQLNWSACRTSEERDRAFAALLTALDTDLDWSRFHTRLLTRAIAWDAGHDASSLLRGRELEEAIRELASHAATAPVPTELQ